jgi:hypothetical protein
MPTIDHPSLMRLAIERIPCPKCATLIDLSRVGSGKPGFDYRIFECPNCGHSVGRLSWRPLH